MSFVEFLDHHFFGIAVTVVLLAFIAAHAWGRD